MSLSSLNDAVRIEPHPETQPPTLDLIDDIQGVRVQLQASHDSRLTRCSTDPFSFPVDVAYDLSPLVLRTHNLSPVIIRNADGNVCAEITKHDPVTLSHGRYTVDICSLGMKVYLAVHGELTISSDGEQTRVIDCSTAESVQIGLRSFHESPTATVTTTDQPRDIMRALSCLGSALKTTSCERSFPTLRGHPPLLERGEAFDAPSGLERTEATASVRIEVPPELESIYPVAPLAYYLNATVVPGKSACLVTPDTTYPLDQGDGVEHGVAQLLKHAFTLDCITRTEGFYPIMLGEREAFEERLADTDIDIDFAALYEQPLAKQLQQYVSVPFDLVEDFVPRWPLTADVRPISDYLPYIPFVVAQLGTFRCLPTNHAQSVPTESPSIEAFCRSQTVASDDFVRSSNAASVTRSGHSEDNTDMNISTDVHTAPDSDSIAQLWLADGYPVQGAKPTLSAFNRHLDAVPSDSIDVAIVSNDTAMRAESDVAELYDRRESLPFEVTVHEGLTKQSLTEVFTGGHDLVHYVGHVDSRGLQCADGWLDTHTLSSVDARAFMLNGCQSYEQGVALTEAGAIGGLCTISNVGNTPATRIGRTVACLLNAGFSLASALELISEEFVTGQQYMIVGDPTLSIVQSKGDTPTLVEITRASDGDTFDVDLYGYLSQQALVGMSLVPILGDSETYYLNSGHLTTLNASHTELAEYLQQRQYPMRIDGSIYWNDAVSIDLIEELT